MEFGLEAKRDSSTFNYEAQMLPASRHSRPSRSHGRGASVPKVPPLRNLMIQESFGEMSPSLQAVQLQIAAANESVKRVGYDRARVESLDGTRQAESPPRHQAEIAIQTTFQAPGDSIVPRLR